MASQTANFGLAQAPYAFPVSHFTSSVGLQLSGLEHLPARLPAPSWAVIVGMTGNSIDVAGEDALSLLHWLRGLRLVAGRLKLLTVCAGAVLAAHAGLLAGRRATTHQQHLDELAAIEPRCDVVANRVFVSDGALYSSAGVATGIDLTRYRIAETCGPAIAAHVAQTLVLAQRRGPEDPQFAPFLDHRNHLHAALHRVQDAVAQAPQQEWSVSAMAAIACTSPRHLTRLFVEHAGIAPGSDTQLRRAWHQFGRVGTPFHLGRRSH